MKSELSTVWSPSRQPAQLYSHPLPPLNQALLDYDRLQRKRFHVPAHAGLNLFSQFGDSLSDPYGFDLTELDGLDVLSEPSGCLLTAQAEIASIFGVAHSYFLLNGATVGLMAAMLSTVRPGEQVLLPRNVHRSLLNGLILTGAEPVWFLPEFHSEWNLWGSVTVAQVQAQLEQYPNAKALFMTSPTYEGIGSDVDSLAAFCRSNNLSLIVDEAHGGLWHFSDQLPISACNAACDAVIHSTHKSAGSLTQGALAHLPKGSGIDPVFFQQVLNTLQTTSPSYLLMASIEAACHYIDSSEGRARIARLLTQTRSLRRDLQRQLKYLRLFEAGSKEFWDPCKLYLMPNPGIAYSEDDVDWATRLEQEKKLAYESTSGNGVLYLANLGLNKDDFQFFEQTLLAEDQRLGELGQPSSSVSHSPEVSRFHPSFSLPDMIMLPRDAFFAPGFHVSSQEAIGRIAKETVVHCPPGIPVLFPGERIKEEHAPYLPEGGLLVVADS